MKHQHFVTILLILLITSCSQNRYEKPSIIELVDTNYRFSTEILIKYCKENRINVGSIYQWQNHWTIYTDQSHVKEIVTILEKRFPHLKITVFDQPFYNFNREKHFHEKPASKWENIIMTANLVEDTIKQKEYMEYHRTQFKKWPEISYGFSKANFQQLLVFRNGRQLMLVISIPKGESLDKLNPQTSENNPRVNDWNSIMSKYQEGIEDAPKGTTWVVFQSLR
jgi:L-rhamnose mutarotase